MHATKILQQTISSALDFVHATRLVAVFWAVRALLQGGRLSLTALGRSAPGRALPKHAIKRVDRLLGNKQLHAQTPAFFKVIAQLLIGARQRPVLIVDWTPTGANHVALVAAVPADGRSLPVFLEVHPKKKDNNAKVMRRFLRRLADILPAQCRPVIVTDAGFRNDWFTDVVIRGWDFVGRVRNNSLTRDLINPTWLPAKSLYKQATTCAKDLGRWVLVFDNPRALRLVLIKKNVLKECPQLRVSNPQQKAKKRAWEPWLLATSLDSTSAKRVVDIYAKRMQIEETFRDAKNHRFGWSFGHARSGSSKRLEVLLLLATLGILAVTLLGNAAENKGLHRRYQANTIRTRRVLSLFFLGVAMVQRSQDVRFTSAEIWASLEELGGKILCVDSNTRSFFVGIP